MASEPVLNFDENCKRLIVQNRTSPKPSINDRVISKVYKTTAQREFSANYGTIKKR